VLELAIRLPPAWPLKPADVECRRKVRPDSVAPAPARLVHRSPGQAIASAPCRGSAEQRGDT
jgi:hypothetical protein